MARGGRVVGLALLLGIGAGSSACGSSLGAAQRQQSAVLKIRCSVDDAELWVDSQYVRTVKGLRSGVRLDAGAHRVELRHQRYHSRYFELELAPGETKLLEVEMARKFP